MTELPGNMMRVLGIDPSLNNTGLAVCAINKETLQIHSIDYLRLASTDASPHKKDVRKNSDDLRRASEIFQAIKMVAADYNCSVACAEIPTGTQSARGSISNGICIGILGCLSPLSIYQVLPSEVKMQSVGTKTATKEEMVRWAYEKDPKANWLTSKRENDWNIGTDGKWLTKKNEHLADAVATVHATIRSDPFRQALIMSKLLK